MRKRYAAQYKFARLDAMNGLIDAMGSEAGGVAKAKRRLNDTWNKRVSNNVTGFYDPKKAKAQHGVC